MLFFIYTINMLSLFLTTPGTFDASSLTFVGSSVLQTLWSLFLYSLIFALVLTVIYYLALPLFTWLSEKLPWIIAVFIASFIFVLLGVIVIYLLPALFLNWKFAAYEQAINKWLFLLKLAGSFLYSAFLITLVIQPLIYIGAFLLKRFKYTLSILNTLLTMFILGIVVCVFFLLFPWVIGGILVLIFF